MTRLTDEELNSLDTTASWLVNKPDRVKLLDENERRVGMRISLVIAELRARRAADLSAEDVEALRWLRERWAEDENVCGASEWRRMYPIALAVLDKLIGGGRDA